MENMNNNYLFATIKSWNIEAVRKLVTNNPQLNIDIVTSKEDLTYERVKSFNPRYVFFPHWSWMIPKKIYDNFECVVFHMTDLPFGRGGSPLQNLIERGIYKTKVSALKVTDELDAGPIYMKCNLDLNGTATEVFTRLCRTIFKDMVPKLIHDESVPVPQEGQVVTFKRRTPEQSDISELADNKKIYDYIRMLDAEGYPPAFIETSKLKVEFSKAKAENGFISAQAIIKVKDE